MVAQLWLLPSPTNPMFIIGPSKGASNFVSNLNICARFVPCDNMVPQNNHQCFTGWLASRLTVLKVENQTFLAARLSNDIFLAGSHVSG